MVIHVKNLTLVARNTGGWKLGQGRSIFSRSKNTFGMKRFGDIKMKNMKLSTLQKVFYSETGRITGQVPDFKNAILELETTEQIS